LFNYVERDKFLFILEQFPNRCQMKKHSKRVAFLAILSLLQVCISVGLRAQNVGINTSGSIPAASAGLDIDFADKGLLIPRVTLTQTSSNAPIGAGVATSLLVYNTATINDVSPGYYYWGGSAWVRIATGSGASGWLLTGNTGTNPATNFAGTSDAQDFVLRANNVERERITSAGFVNFSPSSLPLWGTPPQLKVKTDAAHSYALQLLFDDGNTANPRITFGTGAGTATIETSGNISLNTDITATSGTGYQLRTVNATATLQNRITVTSGVNTATIAMLNSNVGIGIATPDASAKLDITSTNMGVLVPRVALTQTTSNAPVGASVATSLLVYNTATVNDVTPGYYYWGGSSWLRIATGSGGGSGWLLTGNGGTNASTNFIGTTDAVDWVIRTNNSERIRVASAGNVGIHTTVSAYRGVNNSFAPTALDNAINASNTSLYNGFSTGVTNNAICAGTVNDVSVTTNFQNQFAQTSGLTAGTYNNIYVGNNGGTNPGIYGKTCGSYNYSFAVTNGTYGNIYGSYNYGIAATAQPADASTYGAYNYGIVNSPNTGDIYGSYNSGMSNGINNAGGRIYGTYTTGQSNGVNNGTIYGVYNNTQSNGANNATMYGIYNMTGSNGPNAAGSVRYGIYNTWTENALPSTGNSYGIYNVNGAYAGSTNTVYGLYSDASGGTTSYAIFAKSTGSTNNWAAWFADGNIGISNSTGTASELRFYEPSGSNYTSFKAPAQAGNINYTLPATVVAGNYLQTDGSGNLSWAAPGSGGGSGQIQYPDGTSGLTAVIQTNLAAVPYTVPAGKNLNITGYYCPNNNVNLTAGGKVLYKSYNCFQNGSWAGTSPFNPFIVPAGTTVTVASGPGGNEAINGFIVDATVTPVVLNNLSSTPYTVPAGMTLYILNYYSMNSSGGLYIGGIRMYYGYGNFNNTSSGYAWDNLRNPLFVPAGSVVSTNDDAITINGYLK
jgi:hypothetical protein